MNFFEDLFTKKKESSKASQKKIKEDAQKKHPHTRRIPRPIVGLSKSQANIATKENVPSHKVAQDISRSNPDFSAQRGKTSRKEPNISENITANRKWIRHIRPKAADPESLQVAEHQTPVTTAVNYNNNEIVDLEKEEGPMNVTDSSNITFRRGQVAKSEHGQGQIQGQGEDLSRSSSITNLNVDNKNKGALAKVRKSASKDKLDKIVDKKSDKKALTRNNNKIDSENSYSTDSLQEIESLQRQLQEMANEKTNLALQLGEQKGHMHALDNEILNLKIIQDRLNQENSLLRNRLRDVSHSPLSDNEKQQLLLESHRHHNSAPASIATNLLDDAGGDVTACPTPDWDKHSSSNVSEVSVACLQDKIHQMQETHYSTNEELQATLQELTDLQRQLTELQQDNERLSEEKNLMFDSLCRQTERLNDTRTEVESLKQLLYRDKDDTGQFESVVEREQKLVDLLKSAQEERETLLLKQEQLNNELQETRAANIEQAAVNDQLTERVRTLESTLDAKHAEHKQLDQELALAKDQSSGRQIEINRLTDLLDNARTKIVELEQDRALSDKSELDELLDNARKEKDALESEVAHLKEQVARSRNEAEKLRDQISILQEECKVTRNNAKCTQSELEYKCEKLAADKGVVNDQLQQLQEAANELQVQAQCQLEDKRQLSSVLSETQRNLSEAERRNAELENEVAEVKRLREEENEEWEKFQNDLLTSVRVANDFKTEAQQDLQKMIMENKSHRERVRQLEAQLDKMKGGEPTEAFVARNDVLKDDVTPASEVIQTKETDNQTKAKSPKGFFKKPKFLRSTKGYYVANNATSPAVNESATNVQNLRTVSPTEASFDDITFTDKLEETSLHFDVLKDMDGGKSDAKTKKVLNLLPIAKPDSPKRKSGRESVRSTKKDMGFIAKHLSAQEQKDLLTLNELYSAIDPNIPEEDLSAEQKFIIKLKEAYDSNLRTKVKPVAKKPKDSLAISKPLLNSVILNPKLKQIADDPTLRIVEDDIPRDSVHSQYDSFEFERGDGRSRNKFDDVYRSNIEFRYYDVEDTRRTVQSFKPDDTLQKSKSMNDLFSRDEDYVQVSNFGVQRNISKSSNSLTNFVSRVRPVPSFGATHEHTLSSKLGDASSHPSNSSRGASDVSIETLSSLAKSENPYKSQNLGMTLDELYFKIDPDLAESQLTKEQIFVRKMKESLDEMGRKHTLKKERRKKMIISGPTKQSVLQNPKLVTLIQDPKVLEVKSSEPKENKFKKFLGKFKTKKNISADATQQGTKQTEQDTAHTTPSSSTGDQKFAESEVKAVSTENVQKEVAAGAKLTEDLKNADSVTSLYETVIVNSDLNKIIEGRKSFRSTADESEVNTDAPLTLKTKSPNGRDEPSMPSPIIAREMEEASPFKSFDANDDVLFNKPNAPFPGIEGNTEIPRALKIKSFDESDDVPHIKSHNEIKSRGDDERRSKQAKDIWVDSYDVVVVRQRKEKVTASKLRQSENVERLMVKEKVKRFSQVPIIESVNRYVSYETEPVSRKGRLNSVSSGSSCEEDSDSGRKMNRNEMQEENNFVGATALKQGADSAKASSKSEPKSYETTEMQTDETLLTKGIDVRYSLQDVRHSSQYVQHPTPYIQYSLKAPAAPASPKDGEMGGEVKETLNESSGENIQPPNEFQDGPVLATDASEKSKAGNVDEGLNKESAVSLMSGNNFEEALNIKEGIEDNEVTHYVLVGISDEEDEYNKDVFEQNIRGAGATIEDLDTKNLNKNVMIAQDLNEGNLKLVVSNTEDSNNGAFNKGGFIKGDFNKDDFDKHDVGRGVLSDKYPNEEDLIKDIKDNKECLPEEDLSNDGLNGEKAVHLNETDVNEEKLKLADSLNKTGVSEEVIGKENFNSENLNEIERNVYKEDSQRDNLTVDVNEKVLHRAALMTALNNAFKSKGLNQENLIEESINNSKLRKDDVQIDDSSKHDVYRLDVKKEDLKNNDFHTKEDEADEDLLGLVNQIAFTFDAGNEVTKQLEDDADAKITEVKSVSAAEKSQRPSTGLEEKENESHLASLNQENLNDESINNNKLRKDDVHIDDSSKHDVYRLDVKEDLKNNDFNTKEDEADEDLQRLVNQIAFTFDAGDEVTKQLEDDADARITEVKSISAAEKSQRPSNVLEEKENESHLASEFSEEEPMLLLSKSSEDKQDGEIVHVKTEGTLLTTRTLEFGNEDGSNRIFLAEKCLNQQDLNEESINNNRLRKYDVHIVDSNKNGVYRLDVKKEDLESDDFNTKEDEADEDLERLVNQIAFTFDAGNELTKRLEDNADAKITEVKSILAAEKSQQTSTELEEQGNEESGTSPESDKKHKIEPEIFSNRSTPKSSSGTLPKGENHLANEFYKEAPLLSVSKASEDKQDREIVHVKTEDALLTTRTTEVENEDRSNRKIIVEEDTPLPLLLENVDSNVNIIPLGPQENFKEVTVLRKDVSIDKLSGDVYNSALNRDVNIIAESSLQTVVYDSLIESAEGKLERPFNMQVLENAQYEEAKKSRFSTPKIFHSAVEETVVSWTISDEHISEKAVASSWIQFQITDAPDHASEILSTTISPVQHTTNTSTADGIQLSKTAELGSRNTLHTLVLQDDSMKIKNSSFIIRRDLSSDIEDKNENQSKNMSLLNTELNHRVSDTTDATDVSSSAFDITDSDQHFGSIINPKLPRSQRQSSSSDTSDDEVVLRNLRRKLDEDDIDMLREVQRKYHLKRPKSDINEEDLRLIELAKRQYEQSDDDFRSEMFENDDLQSGRGECCNTDDADDDFNDSDVFLRVKNGNKNEAYIEFDQDIRPVSDFNDEDLKIIEMAKNLEKRPTSDINEEDLRIIAMAKRRDSERRISDASEEHPSFVNLERGVNFNTEGTFLAGNQINVFMPSAESLVQNSESTTIPLKDGKESLNTMNCENVELSHSGSNAADDFNSFSLRDDGKQRLTLRDSQRFKKVELDRYSFDTTNVYEPVYANFSKYFRESRKTDSGLSSAHKPPKPLPRQKPAEPIEQSQSVPNSEASQENKLVCKERAKKDAREKSVSIETVDVASGKTDDKSNAVDSIGHITYQIMDLTKSLDEEEKLSGNVKNSEVGSQSDESKLSVGSSNSDEMTLESSGNCSKSGAIPKILKHVPPTANNSEELVPAELAISENNAPQQTASMEILYDSEGSTQTSQASSNVVDQPYLNLFKSPEQVIFENISETEKDKASAFTLHFFKAGDLSSDVSESSTAPSEKVPKPTNKVSFLRKRFESTDAESRQSIESPSVQSSSSKPKIVGVVSRQNSNENEEKRSLDALDRAKTTHPLKNVPKVANLPKNQTARNVGEIGNTEVPQTSQRSTTGSENSLDALRRTSRKSFENARSIFETSSSEGLHIKPHNSSILPEAEHSSENLQKPNLSVDSLEKSK